MLRAAVSMLSLASSLGDSSVSERLVGQVGLVQKAESRAAALAGFQKFADGLVAQYMADGKELDDTTKEAIATVITYIDSFYNSSSIEHDVDYNRVDLCPGSIESCVTDYWPENTTTKINELTKKTNELRDKHLECQQTKKDCPIIINEACQLYDATRMNYDSLSACVMAGHLDDSYIQADHDDKTEAAMLQDMEVCLVEFKHNWFDPLYKLYAACKRGPPPCPQCDSEQFDFEAEHCELTIDREHACTTYTNCVTREEARCGAEGSVCSEVAINVGARKADNETGERIKCLLSVLIDSSDEDKPDDLAACVKKTYDTSHFDITCPARPVNALAPPFNCEDKSFREAPPCGQEFVDAEYPSTFPNFQAVRCNCRVCVSFLPGSQRVDGCEQFDILPIGKVG